LSLFEPLSKIECSLLFKKNWAGFLGACEKSDGNAQANVIYLMIKLANLFNDIDWDISFQINLQLMHVSYRQLGP
jgi:hypothetical protein